MDLFSVRMARGVILALAIAASVPAYNLDAVKAALVKAAQLAGCANPRVAMVSEWPDMRIEVDCPSYEEGYL